MADYQQVSKFTGFSVYIENDYTSTVNSGYTIASPFILRANLTAGSSPANILNACKVLWYFGDGTQQQTLNIVDSNIQSSAHYYNWPGQYEVKLSIISNDGLSSTTFSKVLSVTNFAQDSLQWNYEDWSELSAANLSAGALFHGYQSCKPGNLNDDLPLTVNFTTSVTLSDRISFDLYAQDSLSQPWEQATADNRYSRLRPRWRFLDENNNIVDTLKPSTNITPVIIDSKGRTEADSQFDIATQKIVGYTGSILFYYIDDIPSLSYNGSNYTVNVPILWVTANTSTYPNPQDKNDSDRYSYSNSTLTLSSKFYIKNLSASHFNFSLNGGTIPLPGTLWPEISSNLIVTVNSQVSSSSINTGYANKVLLNYPINYNNGVILLSADPAAFTFAASSFNLTRYDAANRDTGGFYKNILYTLNTDSPLLSSGSISATLVALTTAITIVIEPSADPLSGYNPDTRAEAASASNALTAIPLSGSATYSVLDFNKNYFIRKINEDFNYGNQLKTYALQSFIADSTNMLATLSAMAGDSYTTDESFGTVVYEKIANFSSNTQDIYNANVNSLYSLSNLIDTQYDDYNLNPPPVLKRMFDLLSVPHERLWGTKEKFNLNFDNALYHVNLGTELTAYDIDAAIVSAGQKIVLNDIFQSSFYELLEVPVINSYASVTAANMQSYFLSSATYPLSSYPLSSFFGWGVKTPVKNYYKFWVFKDSYTDTQKDNLIDWTAKTDGLSTTLSETNSSINDWYRDGGIVENIYSYYLYKGLNLN